MLNEKYNVPGRYRPGIFLLFLTGKKEIITKHKTGDNKYNSKKTAFYKKHNSHADCNPK